MIFIISLCAAGTVLLFLLGMTMKSEHAVIQGRIIKHSQPVSMPIAGDSDMSLPLRDRVILPALRALASVIIRLTPSGAVQTAESALDAAGRPWRLGGIEFIGLKVLCAGVFFLIALAAANSLPLGPLVQLALFILLVAVGLLLPDAALSNAISQRQSAIRRALPDTLDLLLVSVEAGLGLDGAIQKVVEKFDNPLSRELSLALQEMQFGKRRAEALRDMADRSRVAELSAFVAAIIQAEQLGGGIAKVLRVQSETLRTQRSIRAREAASKLPVKMLVPLVFFIFPSLFVVLLAPGVVRIARALSSISQ